MLAKEKSESVTERIGDRRMEKRARWPEIGSSEKEKKTRSGYGSQKENISATLFTMRQENSFRCHHHQMKEIKWKPTKKGDKVGAISACFAQNH